MGTKPAEGWIVADVVESVNSVNVVVLTFVAVAVKIVLISMSAHFVLNESRQVLWGLEGPKGSANGYRSLRGEHTVTDCTSVIVTRSVLCSRVYMTSVPAAVDYSQNVLPQYSSK